MGTNALLERKGARVAFVTTAGFEDTIEIGRQNRPKLYDLLFERIPPLVERNMRFGVNERVATRARFCRPPTAANWRDWRRTFRLSGAESIALSTLFSFANPVNEQAIAQVLEELALPLSVSHEILPEFREYERASTVVINAYLQPLMQHYLHSLRTRITEQTSKRSRIFIMQSSGGTTALESAVHQPVRTVLSGPAGGIVGATVMARRSGFADIITFDMGGTSTDVALVRGDPQPTNEAEVAGFPVRVPVLDIHTVGAGGGSLAHFDAGGALRVGPESAGADPGPICYGRGTRPTVTDANLLLGRLQPDRFLGGEFTLDIERTRQLTTEWLAAARLRAEPAAFRGRRGSGGERQYGTRPARGLDRAWLRSPRICAGRLWRCRRVACLRTGRRIGHSHGNRAGVAGCALGLRHSQQRHHQGLFADGGLEDRSCASRAQAACGIGGNGAESRSRLPP